MQTSGEKPCRRVVKTVEQGEKKSMHTSDEKPWSKVEKIMQMSGEKPCRREVKKTWNRVEKNHGVECERSPNNVFRTMEQSVSAIT